GTVKVWSGLTVILRPSGGTTTCSYFIRQLYRQCLAASRLPYRYRNVPAAVARDGQDARIEAPQPVRWVARRVWLLRSAMSIASSSACSWFRRGSTVER